MDNIKFKQHIPNFAEGYTPIQIEGSWEEIIKHDFFKNSMNTNDGFSMVFNGESDDSNGRLLVQNEDNSVWYVIGFLNKNPGLPRWIAPKDKNIGNVKNVQLSLEEKKLIEDRFNSKIIKK